MAASKLSASHTHEVFTHTAFDRDYLNIRNPGLLPASARRKFLLSIRTAYTVMLCIALTYYLDFGQSGSYLAPIYSAISGGSLYVGQWQGDMWRAIYSALICGGIGVFIGLFTWHIIPLQLILQFIALTWMNRISSWDRLPKVIGGVSIILGVLWPSTSSGVLSGAKAFSYIIEIHYIPYIITGLTLFFPYVSLATFAAQKKVDDICNKLNSATVALTRAFCATDYVDLYNAQINQLLLNSVTCVDELTVLKGFVEHEAILFTRLVHLGPALAQFIEIASKVIIEISGLRDMLQRIVNNKTQAKFAEHLKSSLGELSAGVTIILDIVREHVNSFAPYNPRVDTFISDFKSFFFQRCHGMLYFESNLTDIESGLNSKLKKYQKNENERNENKNANKNKSWFSKNPKKIRKRDNDNDDDGSEGREHSRRIHSFAKTTGRLKTSQFELLSAYKETRSQFVWGQKVRVLAIKKRMSESNLSALINDEFKRVNSNRDFAAVSKDDVLDHMSRNVLLELELEVVGRVECLEGNVLSHIADREMNSDGIYRDGGNDVNRHEKGKGNDNRLGCYDACIDEGGGREGGERGRGGGGDVQSRKRSISGVSIGQINEIIESLEREKSGVASVAPYTKINSMNPDMQGGSGCDERANSMPHVTDSRGGRKDKNRDVEGMEKDVQTIEKEREKEREEEEEEEDNMLAEAAAAVHAESLLLSWKNLAPRGAYLHRISILTEIFTTFENVLTARERKQFSIFSFIYRNFLVVFWYIFDCIRTVVENFCFFVGILSNFGIQQEHTSDGKSHTWEIICAKAKQLMKAYTQPAKIALSITITSLFVVLPGFRDQQQQNGIWATAAICFIRQDNTTSTFLVGYQRLEGSVIGAIYAFAMFQMLDCTSSEDACGIKATLPVLVLWTAVCAFFREGPRHGYAALVASFTPAVLFLGATPGTAAGAWVRVEATFLGVAVYLLIDNCFLPFRTDRALRLGFVTCVEETRAVFSEAINAVMALVSLNENTAEKNMPQLVLSDKKKGFFSGRKIGGNKIGGKKGANFGSFDFGVIVGRELSTKNCQIAEEIKMKSSSAEDKIKEGNNNNDNNGNNGNNNNDNNGNNDNNNNNNNNNNNDSNDHDRNYENNSGKYESSDSIGGDIDNKYDDNKSNNKYDNCSGTNDDNQDIKNRSYDPADATIRCCTNSNDRIPCDCDTKKHHSRKVDKTTNQKKKTSNTMNAEEIVKTVKNAKSVNSDFESYRIGFQACQNHLTSCDAALGRLKLIAGIQSTHMRGVIHEPEVLQNCFPVSAYQPLLDSFFLVLRSGRSVASATKSFSTVLKELASRDEVEHTQNNMHTDTHARVCVLTETDTYSGTSDPHSVAVQNSLDLVGHSSTSQDNDLKTRDSTDCMEAAYSENDENNENNNADVRIDIEMNIDENVADGSKKNKSNTRHIHENKKHVNSSTHNDDDDDSDNDDDDDDDDYKIDCEEEEEEEEEESWSGVALAAQSAEGWGEERNNNYDYNNNNNRKRYNSESLSCSAHDFCTAHSRNQNIRYKKSTASKHSRSRFSAQEYTNTNNNNLHRNQDGALNKNDPARPALFDTIPPTSPSPPSLIALHLETFAYMHTHLLAVSSKADAALGLAAIALKKLFTERELLTDLTAIVTLSRECDTLLRAVDDHFRNVYSRLDFLASLDPFFMIAYQDIFESVCELVRRISELGVCLHSVRDVEALSVL